MYGRALARTFGGRLHVLHVVDNVAARLAYADASMAGFAPPERQADIERAATKDLEAVVGNDDRRELRAATVYQSEYQHRQRDHGLRPGGVDRRDRHWRDRSGAIDRMLTGSVADKVIRRAPCPVLAVRHPEHEFVIPDAPQHVVHMKAWPE